MLSETFEYISKHSEHIRTCLGYPYLKTLRKCEICIKWGWQKRYYRQGYTDYIRYQFISIWAPFCKYRLSAILKYWFISYRHNFVNRYTDIFFLQCFTIFLEFLLSVQKICVHIQISAYEPFTPILGTVENLLIVWHHTEKPHN